ncbi:hypothetical protein CLAIMM_05110 [Cladophialophora immunda]|nr:hypothetical protein CLAIMM_05110 [Cladophialophora immunda]
MTDSLILTGEAQYSTKSPAAQLSMTLDQELSLSGIEIVGLVLGAVPLFISVAEHYRGALQFIIRAIHQKQFIKQYKDELELQRTLLCLYVKAVVGRTDLPPEAQAELIDHPDGNAWRRPNVVKELRNELKDAYQPFIALLVMICTTLAKQILTDDATVDNSTKDELVNKLEKLCLDAAQQDASGQQDVWKRIKSYNVSLEKLGSTANHVKPYERKQQVRRAHTTFQLRGDSEKLYKVICRACNCQPLKQRNVGLGLAVHDHDNASTEDLCFQLLLFGPDDKVCKVSIKMMKRRSQQNHQRRSAQSSITPPVQDPVLSLWEVMSNFKLNDRKWWLQREKAILAVILSYSLLQLHESSWWQTLWNSEGISFHGVGSSNLAAGRSPDQRIRLRRPFARSVITEADVSGGPGAAPRRNAHLHALGIILLEIYLDRPIKDDVDAVGGTDYRAVAQDLLEKHSDDMDMTPEYLRGIRFCLCPHPNPYSGSFSFVDKGFREIFYTEVISLLEDNLMSRFEVNDTIWQNRED